MAPALGSPAPDLALDGWYDGEVRRFVLSEQRGHPVVLAFYPGDSTPGCTRQLCSYSDDWDLLTSTGAVLWASPCRTSRASAASPRGEA
jgi:thioredoxin-dependent peroxiredoxin